MRKRLTLIGPADRILYQRLVFGFLSGANAREDRTKERIYQLSRIKKALFVCGELLDVPLQADVQDAEAVARLNDPTVVIYRPGQAVRLKPGSHVIDLAVGDWALVEKHLTNAPWQTIAADEVADLYDRIDTAETIKD